MDLLLATPSSRTRVLLEKSLAFALACALIGLLIGLLIAAGFASLKVTVDFGASLATGLQWGLLSFFFGTVALLLSQLFSSRGAAAGWAAAFMVITFLLDGMGRTVNGAGWLQYLSPFYYYGLSKPIVPSYSSNPWGLVVLAALCIVCIAASLLLLVRRDIGGVAVAAANRTTHAHQASLGRLLKQAKNDVFGRSVGLRAFRAQLTPLFWWLLGIIALAAALTLLIPSLESAAQKALTSSPVLEKLFNGQNVGTNAGFLGGFAFTFITPLVAAFAMTQALTWSSDLEKGRLELILSTPRSRWRVELERFTVVLIGTLLAPSLILLTIVLCAKAVNINVDSGSVAAASFGILPLELILATLVFAIAGRLRYSIVLSIVVLYLVLAYALLFLSPIMNLPTWVLDTSIFYQYGNPMVDGWKWAPMLTMTAIALILLVIGVGQFRTVDLERGS